MWCAAPLLAIALSLFGCATVGVQDPTAYDSGARNRAGITVENRINHVVLLWLKASGNAAHRERIIEISKTFEKIPGVLKVRVGEAVPSERAMVNDSFDLAISIAFANTDEMNRYLAHPRHQEAVREVLSPLVARIVVYDFVE
uniref:Stress responsive A/B Barrel Domain n=1 Tax=Candidatus Kentrum eta TaxID=2126337 RepID=A0A450VIB7_9GAMM|nr:MAG: Stress responsive A/B Barrel Domain [Candidatus Kentron sp. H]VFK05484.1 MAG: Stress responsive A/B Barrel Domain [Candidatus Kentron sp. H]VFK07733.1 MAG: Stress responsive A/B Barrel Domain [Candidatus Kentron sp. H]